MTEVIVNGRFLSQPVTGVQRFAREILKQWDQMVAEGFTSVAGRMSLSVVVPPGTSSDLGLRAIDVVTAGRGTGHAWEQGFLSRFRPSSLLVGMCNTGPALRSSQLVVIHDAAVFSAPAAYGWAFRTWYRTLFRLLALRAGGIATVSAFSRREIRRHLGREATVVPESGEHILSIAPAPGVMREKGLEGMRFVLAVSSMNPNKNFGTVVRAFAQLGMKDVRLVVAGGTNPRVFASGAAELGGVDHLGYVTDGELRTLYENASAFVFPSRYEGFGIPPIEAMACGCPVIAARAASIPEACGEAAVYFDPESADELAVRIREVLGNEGMRDRMIREGLHRSASMSWRTAAERLWACVEHVASGGSARRLHREAEEQGSGT